MVGAVDAETWPAAVTKNYIRILIYLLLDVILARHVRGQSLAQATMCRHTAGKWQPPRRVPTVEEEAAVALAEVACPPYPEADLEV